MAIKVPPEEQGPCRRRRCCIGIICALLALFLAAIIVLLTTFASMEPRYYAAIAIDAVSGLDLATKDHQVEFNLTIGVKSRSWLSRGCFEPGVVVTVTYLGVQIADGSTTAQACAPAWKPKQMVRMPVVAHATGEGLPSGSVLRRLAADKRRWQAVFDVSLRIPPWHPCDDGKLVVCRGRLVGGVVEESSVPCDVQTSPRRQELVLHGRTIPDAAVQHDYV